MKKIGAMELTMGTMVVIALLVIVLILGSYFIAKIFVVAETSIDDISKQIESEIQKIFQADETKTIVIYPTTREISIKKGKSTRGFALAIRNIGQKNAKFGYRLEAVQTSCEMSLADAEDLLFQKSQNDIQITAGEIMEYPTLVKFIIPEDAPPCLIKYDITMTKGDEPYGSSVDVYVEILGK